MLKPIGLLPNRILKLLLGLLISSNIFSQSYENYKTILDTTFLSTTLNYEKSIAVTVPWSWEYGQKTHYSFPLIIMFDQQNQRSHNYMLNTIDYLTSNDQMPASIVVSVKSDQEHRLYETLHRVSSEKGGAEINEAFIFDELIPFVKKKFGGGEFNLLIGHSRYGYFTTELFASRINDLNAVVSLSPFFFQENVNLCDSIQGLTNSKTEFHRYYRFGIGEDYPKDFHAMDKVVKKINNEKLNCKGYLFEQAGHNVTPGLTIGAALYEIFEKWALYQNAYFDNGFRLVEQMEDFELKIASHYGTSFSFSIGVLNGKGWYLYGENEFDLAIAAWQQLVKYYPNFSEAYLSMIDADLQKSGTINQQLKKQFLSSLEKSTLYTDEEKQELLDELDELSKL